MWLRRLSGLAAVTIVSAIAACDPESPPTADDVVAICQEGCAERADRGCGPEISEEYCRQLCEEAEVDELCLAELVELLEWQRDNPCADVGLEQLEPYYACRGDDACATFCAAARDAGCADDGCEALCSARTAAQKAVNAYVDVLYGDVLACASGGGVTCASGAPSAAGCTSETAVLVDALDGYDLCPGWCALDEVLGCGESCDTCEAASEVPCFISYLGVVMCGLVSVDPLTCVDGEIAVGPGCADEVAIYDACIAES